MIISISDKFTAVSILNPVIKSHIQYSPIVDLALYHLLLLLWILVFAPEIMGHMKSTLKYCLVSFKHALYL